MKMSFMQVGAGFKPTPTVFRFANGYFASL